MAKKKTQTDNSLKKILPNVILLKSENINIDYQKTSEEIRYFITQIILLADKMGRPAKNQCTEVSDAA